MPRSPASADHHRRHISDSDFYQIMSAAGNSSAAVAAAKDASAHASHTSSPYNIQSAGEPSSSTPQAQSFNIDSFDFGPDFSLPSGLDELSIFSNSNNHANQQHGNAGDSSVASQSGSQASPGGHLIHAPNGLVSKVMPTSSNNSTAGSPHQHYSPRIKMREQVLQAANSRHHSPRMVSSTSNDGSGSRANTTSTGVTLSAGELQNLLNAINASAASQQQNRNQLQGGNLSMAELEKLLAEKEQMEHAQSVQTAFLRQQLESLQRNSPGGARQQGPEGHSGAGGGGSDSSSVASAAASGLSASQLMHQFQQLTSQQNGNGAASMYPSNNFQMPSGSTSGMPAHNAAFNANAAAQKVGASLNQYGLVTPASSGAFQHQASMPFVSPLSMPGSSQAPMMDATRMHDHSGLVGGTFTPLESPAITPASVFSNMSTATSTDLFSPLTSPALHPQNHPMHEALAMQLSPFHGPTQIRRAKPGGRVGPGASPVALTGVTKSVPRKNRSTTAEARANRARASPLVKPTNTASNATTRRRNGSTAGDGAPQRQTSQGDGGSGSDGKQTPQAFPPLSAGSGSAKPMDASPSETAASTPSPIEMPPPNGKPMTPSTMMGMQRQPTRDRPSPNDHSQPNAARAAKMSKTGGESNDGSADTSRQVSFAAQSPGGLQNILPGGLSAQEREAWLSTMRSTGGGGLDSRRTSHKAAEQKRRDSLKYCFDELRGMLPAITLDDDVPGGSMLGPDGLLEDQDAEGFGIEEVGDAESARIANRAISKVALLRHSNEYLVRLKHRMGRRERDLAVCRREIMELRSRLGMPIAPDMPALTVSMAGSAAMAGHNMSGIMNGLEALSVGAASADQTHQQHQAALFSAWHEQQQQQQQMQAAAFSQPHAPSHVTSMDTS